MDLRPPQKEIVDALTKGTITSDDVKALEEKLGLKVDGVFDENVAKQIVNYLNVDPMLTLNLSNNAIQLLKDFGQGQAYKDLVEKFENDFPFAQNDTRQEAKDLATSNGYGATSEAGQYATEFAKVNGELYGQPNGPAPELDFTAA